jgi:3-oxoacyl-[acyl-carrier-protein] synthase II
MVTGMGFCLPGEGRRPILTAADLWHVASRGATCLRQDGMYHGTVHLSEALFQERLPDVPPFFSRHYTQAHRFGLVSMAEACADAELDIHAGELSQAAVLVGRGSVDSNIASYLAVLQADPDTTTAAETMELYIAAEQAVTPSDVALVQGALARTSGPCFTVSCGCASSALQIGLARRMIADGEVDLAVVTGVDVFDIGIIRRGQQLLRNLKAAYQELGPAEMPSILPSFDSLMRPYDRRADCINHGEGSATVILESREHAAGRGAHQYGRVLAQATTRDGLAHPLASDDTGRELANAVRRCLGDRWDISQVRYVHGGSDGNSVVTAFEANAIRELYGSAASRLLMTSHEGCFGHNGAAAGCLGVAMTLLMMERGEVCPTANCEEPADGLPFDPVPGVCTRPLDFDHALSFNYSIGGVKSAILLGSPEAA